MASWGIVGASTPGGTPTCRAESLCGSLASAFAGTSQGAYSAHRNRTHSAAPSRKVLARRGLERLPHFNSLTIIGRCARALQQLGGLDGYCSPSGQVPKVTSALRCGGRKKIPVPRGAGRYALRFRVQSTFCQIFLDFLLFAPHLWWERRSAWPG
jgi:hypothetical protein